jgi:hypothetical protein
VLDAFHHQQGVSDTNRTAAMGQTVAEAARRRSEQPPGSVPTSTNTRRSRRSPHEPTRHLPAAALALAYLSLAAVAENLPAALEQTEKTKLGYAQFLHDLLDVEVNATNSADSPNGCGLRALRRPNALIGPPDLVHTTSSGSQLGISMIVDITAQADVNPSVYGRSGPKAALKCPSTAEPARKITVTLTGVL